MSADNVISPLVTGSSVLQPNGTAFWTFSLYNLNINFTSVSHHCSMIAMKQERNFVPSWVFFPFLCVAQRYRRPRDSPSVCHLQSFTLQARTVLSTLQARTVGRGAWGHGWPRGLCVKICLQELWSLEGMTLVHLPIIVYPWMGKRVHLIPTEKTLLTFSVYPWDQQLVS